MLNFKKNANKKRKEKKRKEKKKKGYNFVIVEYCWTLKTWNKNLKLFIQNLKIITPG